MEKKDFQSSTVNERNFEVPLDGVVVLSITGISKLYNVFQKK
jgi:hypothetical protein